MPIVNGTWVAPTNANFKSYFVRDFQYAGEDDQSNINLILDSDLSNASLEAQTVYNSGLFGNNADTFFYYLWAHFLSINLQNSMKGISAQAQFPASSINIAGVSVSNQISERFQSDPIFSELLTTGYGRKYLMFVYPYTIGNTYLVCGTSTEA